MTISELAKKLGIAPKKLLRKARVLLGSGVYSLTDHLDNNQINLLKAHSHKSISQLKNVADGLRSKYGISTLAPIRIPDEDESPKLSQASAQKTKTVPTVLTSNNRKILNNLQNQTALLQNRIDNIANEIRQSSTVKNKYHSNQVNEPVRNLIEGMMNKLKSELSNELQNIQKKKLNELEYSISDNLNKLANEIRQSLREKNKYHSNQVNEAERNLIEGMMNKLKSELSNELQNIQKKKLNELEYSILDNLRRLNNNELVAQTDKTNKKIVAIERKTTEIESKLDAIHDNKEDFKQIKNNTLNIVETRKKIKYLEENILKDVRQELKRNTADISKIQKEMTSFKKDISKVNELYGIYHKRWEKYEDNLERVINAVEESYVINSPKLIADYKKCLRVLESKGLFYEESVIKKCVSAIENGNNILLKGPPGTGKSELAQVLPYFFFKEDPSVNKNLLTIKVAQESWQSMHVYGDNWLLGDKIIFEMGCFPQAVIKCIEQKGQHWLFIDELNNSDINCIFSALLPVLGHSRPEKYFNHPELDKDMLIPSSFRLICALDDSDQKIYSLKKALLDRFTQIDIFPPSIENERKIIYHILKVNQKKHKHLLSNFKLWKNNKDYLFPQLEGHIDKYLTLLKRIRKIGEETGTFTIGARKTVNVFHYIKNEINKGNTDIALIVDQGISQHIGGYLGYSSIEALQVMINERFFNDYPETHRKTEQIYQKMKRKQRLFL